MSNANYNIKSIQFSQIEPTQIMAETAQNGKKIAAEVLPIIKKPRDKKLPGSDCGMRAEKLIQVPVSRRRRQSRVCRSPERPGVNYFILWLMYT